MEVVCPGIMFDYSTDAVARTVHGPVPVPSDAELLKLD